MGSHYVIIGRAAISPQKLRTEAVGILTVCEVVKAEVFGSSETRSSWVMKTWRKPDKRKSERLGNGLGRNWNH